MRFSGISFFALVFFLLTNLAPAQAQSTKKNSAASAKAARARTDSISKARKEKIELATKARKHAIDSAREARADALDSARASRQHITDSIKLAREERTDSITKARKHITDSTAKIRKYRESRHFRDSVSKSRLAKTNKIKEAREARMDSIRAERKEFTDSLKAVRKERSDSIKLVQKHRSDSLGAIRKYKSSRRYSDSVTLARRHHSDSVKSVQKDFRDSLASIRKHILDSAKISRAHILDSTKTARTKYMDSIKLVRKARTDSLAKKKEVKEKVAKAKEKKKLEDLKLKIDLKQKKEREAWSNKTMLKKKWGPVRKVAQNSFTHYNYYYNAKRKLKEAEDNMVRINREGYDSLIGIFPFDPNKDSSRFAADMDSIVHKVSVGIQIHDPRVKWSDDMYLMLGEAYYYKGNYENASIAFRYIISNNQNSKKKRGKGGKSYYSRSHTSSSIVEKKKTSKLRFLQHRSVHNEAILWLARTYATAGKVENAESVLSLLEYDANLPDNLVGRLAVEKAFAYLKVDNYEEASKQLAIAVDDHNLPEALRLRMAFLNGQILMNSADYAAAAESFEEVLNHYPKIEMDFYTRKYIAYNKLMAGVAIADAMTPLKRMLSDGKYSSYYDQVYFVLGKLAAKANNNKDAIGYLTKSTTTPKATKKQKAMSFAALGDVYYTTSEYDFARNAYDSAAKYSSSASKDKSVAAAVQRSKGLNEISGPALIIHNQDSLLSLAALSKKDQQSAVRRYIRDLEKQREDSIFKAENAALTTLPTSEPGGEAPSSTSWYFSNPTLMTQGSADFKRKWGTRTLTDNWRRAASAPLAGGPKPGSSSSDEESDDGESETDPQSGLPTESALLAKIPNTPQQKDIAVRTQQKAYILLAQAYVKQLEDYGQALHTLDTLNIRYPNHNQKEEELYLRYQIAVKQNKLDKAQEYSSQLLAKYPQSQYVKMLQPGKSESKASDAPSAEVAAYFDKTYSQLMNHQYTEVLMRTEMAKSKYTNPLYLKRFEVTEAMAYAGTGNFAMADSTISRFLKDNPSDTLADWARSVKNYINEVRDGSKPSWYKEGPYTPRVAEKKKEEVKVEPSKPVVPPPPPPVFPDAPKMYGYQPDSAHYFIAVLKGLDSRTAPLKKAIKSFDSAKYASANLEILIDMYSMDEGVLQVKGFSNAEQAKLYLQEIAKSTAFADYETGEIGIYIISANNYKKMFTDQSATNYPYYYTAQYAR